MDFINTQKKVEGKDSNKETQYFDFMLFGSCDYVISDRLGNPIRRCNRPSVGVASFVSRDGEVQEMQLCAKHMFLIGNMARQIAI